MPPSPVTMAADLRLLVYIMGTRSGGSSFSVIIDRSKTVGELKNAIFKEKPEEFKDVDASELTLYKVELINGENLEQSAATASKEKLEIPSCELSEVFPADPPAETVSILVEVEDIEPLFKRPRLDNSGTTKSSPPRSAHEQTEAQVAEGLDSFADYIEYLAAGKLDGYIDSIRPEDKIECPRVELPCDPILLIHDLGKLSDQERISKLFVGGTTYLFNVSGSSKTRLALDGLCHHWGLYISCVTGSPASGSCDFEEAMKLSAGNFSNNHAAQAERVATMLLCARFFILGRLVQHLPVGTDPMVARRRWVLAQALPPVFFCFELFARVVQKLQKADNELMMDITSSSLRTMMERKDLFPEDTPLFLVIDEAQVAADNVTKYLRSESGDYPRPILRQLVHFFESTGIFTGIIISGIGVPLEKVRGAVGYSVKQGHDKAQPRVFTDVGRFTTGDPSQENYIRQYLNIPNDTAGRRLLDRMTYWCSSRYRLTASLIEVFLHSKDVSYHRVLTMFTERITGIQTY